MIDSVNSFDINGNLKILGYFTIALKVLSVPNEVSNSVRKQLDGFNSKNVDGFTNSDFPCYLIGQFGRNSDVSKHDLPGDVLMKCCFDIINALHRLAGGRFVLVESRNIEGLISFYLKNSFKDIYHIKEENDNDEDNDNVKEMAELIYFF